MNMIQLPTPLSNPKTNSNEPQEHQTWVGVNLMNNRIDHREVILSDLIKEFRKRDIKMGAVSNLASKEVH